MPYKFTPYDRKSYRESKKRRRQALNAAKTGRIVPYGFRKRRLIVIISVLLAIIALAASAFWLVSFLSEEGADSKSDNAQTYDNELLLKLVNKQNTLEPDYVPDLKAVGGVSVNSAAYSDLSALIEEAKAQGIELKISKGYVSYENQQKNYEDKLNEYLASPDYTPVRAQAAVQKTVPKGGESEFQTGLLIDFDLSDGKSKRFLERACVNHGFILRYPKGKESLTLMDYDESVYRYVGRENAEKMRSFDMCLEEYRNYLNARES